MLASARGQRQQELRELCRGVGTSQADASECSSPNSRVVRVAGAAAIGVSLLGECEGREPEAHGAVIVVPGIVV